MHRLPRHIHRPRPVLIPLLLHRHRRLPRRQGQRRRRTPHKLPSISISARTPPPPPSSIQPSSTRPPSTATPSCSTKTAPAPSSTTPPSSSSRKTPWSPAKTPSPSKAATPPPATTPKPGTANPHPTTTGSSANPNQPPDNRFPLLSFSARRIHCPPLSSSFRHTEVALPLTFDPNRTPGWVRQPRPAGHPRQRPTRSPSRGLLSLSALTPTRQRHNHSLPRPKLHQRKRQSLCRILPVHPPVSSNPQRATNL